MAVLKYVTEDNMLVVVDRFTNLKKEVRQLSTEIDIEQKKLRRHRWVGHLQKRGNRY